MTLHVFAGRCSPQPFCTQAGNAAIKTGGGKADGISSLLVGHAGDWAGADLGRGVYPAAQVPGHGFNRVRCDMFFVVRLWNLSGDLKPGLSLSRRTAPMAVFCWSQSPCSGSTQMTVTEVFEVPVLGLGS